MSPGWMTSRPRPLGQAGRRIAASRYRTARRAPAEARTAPASPPRPPDVATPAAPPHDAVASAPSAPQLCSMAHAFAAYTSAREAARASKLPVARLLPHRSDGGPRQLTGALHRWLGRRWQWAQPRMIPLLAAFFGLIGVLNARRYLLELARGPAVVCPAPELAHLSGHPPATPGHAIAHHDGGCPAVRGRVR
jgi:hypothetical protein